MLLPSHCVIAPVIAGCIWRRSAVPCYDSRRLGWSSTASFRGARPPLFLPHLFASRLRTRWCSWRGWSARPNARTEQVRCKYAFVAAASRWRSWRSLGWWPLNCLSCTWRLRSVQQITLDTQTSEHRKEESASEVKKDRVQVAICIPDPCLARGPRSAI